MNHYIQVITTTATREDATRIARALVEQQLAGCVQIVGPITSIYRWEGAIEEAEEFLLIVKTRQSLYTTIEATINALHPYDVPEVLAVPVAGGSQSYLDWLKNELTG